LGLDVVKGVPTVISDNPKTVGVRLIMEKFANSIHKAVSNLSQDITSPIISFGTKHDIILQEQDTTRVITARDVRKSCQCALCLQSDKKTIEEKIDSNVSAIDVKKIGNYAVSINWSDGHKGSIYSYDLLKRLSSLRS